MIMRTHTMLFAGVLAVGVLAAAGSAAHGQQQAPPNSLELEATGTYEGPQGATVKFRDEKTKELWLLGLNASTKIVIEGETDLKYLRQGMVVELTGDIDETGKLAEPISEITVLTGKGRPALGLFKPDDDPADARPVRDPEPGKYRVRGRLLSVKEGELSIVAGRLKLAGTAAEDAKVKLNIENPSAAQVGDTMKVTGWYLDAGKPIPAFQKPGQAMAESINITLTTVPDPKKSR